MKRLYKNLVDSHLKKYRQMLFLAGPRQVGKTTIARELKRSYGNYFYFNWDIKEDRETIIAGPKNTGSAIGLDELRSSQTLVVFDEIHKYKKWKQFLKGFFDLYEKRCRILVTGSAKLNIFKRQGDSLMGRYFLYRVHPLTVGELINISIRKNELRPPKKLNDKHFKNLFENGGFPEPYLKKSKRFTKNWQRMRQEQLIKEDIRDLCHIQDLAELDMLVQVLQSEAAKPVSYKSLSNMIGTSEPTIKRWIQSLEQFYYCFLLKPWSKNVRSSLRKTPKLYLWDWSLVQDDGAKVENFIASHLLKAVHYWTDYGLGDYSLCYLRDKQKNEVDFLVTKDNIPWFIVEAKKSKSEGISKSLYNFQKQTGAKHAFQVVFDMEYVDKNCFDYTEPIIVPAATFLSQLV